MRSTWELIKAAQNDYAVRSKLDYTGQDCLYDTQTIAPGTLFPGQFSFFTSPANGGRTFAQTNLQSAGQLSNNDSFLIMAFRFAWFSNAAQSDIEFLCTGTWLDIKFYNRQFFFGVPEMFPAGSTAYTSAATNLGTALAVAGLGPVVSTMNGMPSVHNYFGLGDEGVLLRDNDQLKVTLINEAGPFTTAAAAIGGNGLTMRAWFDGYRIRQSS